MNGQPYHDYVRAVMASALSPAEKVVLVTLADFADENWVAWPSRSKIAAAVRMSVGSLSRVLASLTSAGYLVGTGSPGRMSARRKIIVEMLRQAPSDAAQRSIRHCAKRHQTLRQAPSDAAQRYPTVLYTVLENGLGTGAGAESHQAEVERLKREADAVFGGPTVESVTAALGPSERESDPAGPPTALMLAVSRYCDSTGIRNESTRYRILQECEAWANPESYGPQIVAAGLVWGIEEGKAWRVVASRIRNTAEKDGWIDKPLPTKPKKTPGQRYQERNRDTQ